MMASSSDESSTEHILSPMQKYDCILCKETMTSPQVLSCLHVLCEHCLMSLLHAAQSSENNNDYYIDCPYCEKTVTIVSSSNGNVVSTFNISSNLFTCSTCVKDTNSVFRCQYCEQLFCLGCFRGHGYVVCIQPTKRFKTCSDHNMKSKYICLKCESIVCIFCLTSERHKHHEHISISQAQDDMRARTQKMLDNAKDQSNRCYETISCLREVLTELRIKYEIARHELMMSSFQGFMFFSNGHYNDAAKDLDAIYLEEQRKTKSYMHDLRVYSSNLENSCKSAKKALMEVCSCKISSIISNLRHSIEYDDVSSTSTNDLIIKPFPINVKHRFGIMGNFTGAFNNPNGFCLDPNDDIIVADKKNHRIQIFKKNGTLKLVFGVPGKSEGELSFPSKVAVIRKDNRLVVSDQGIERLRLQIFSKNGIFHKKIPLLPCSNVADLSAMDVTHDGHIVLMDRYGAFLIVSEYGEVINYIDCKLYVTEPSDIAVNDNEILICDYKAHRVAVFSLTSGTFKRYIGNGNTTQFPSGIYVTEDDIFVSDSHNGYFHVARFAPSGFFKASYVCQQMKVFYCHGFRMSSDGDAVALSKGTHCMLIIDKMTFNQKF